MQAALVTAVAFLPLTWAVAQAQDDKTINSNSGVDQRFVQKAAPGGMMEVKLGKLAVESSSNPAIQKFGKRMVDDHTRANEELARILEKKGMPVPKDMEADEQELMDKLTKMKGEEFDRSYMRHMVKDHTKDIELFEEEARSGKDPELQTFAEKTLPTLREHLRLARDIMERNPGS